MDSLEVRSDGPETSRSEGSADKTRNSRTPLVFINRVGAVRLDKFLCDRLPGRSRSFIQRLIRNGHVSISAAGRAKPATVVHLGAHIEVRLPPPSPSELQPLDLGLKILYEDEDLAVIDKPPGIVIHPSPGWHDPTLVNGLLFQLKDLSGIAGKERPGIVHRLDRDTSGILLIAKNDRTHQHFSLQFKMRKVKKTYLALAHANPSLSAGSIDLPIGRSYREPKKMAIRHDGGRAAVTEYRVVDTFGGIALIEAYPRTGRTHQIRVHLRYVGAPILCDSLYGRERAIYRSDLDRRPRRPSEPALLYRQALHAHRLSISRPRGDELLEFESPLPDDLQRVLDHIRATKTSS